METDPKKHLVEAFVVDVPVGDISALRTGGFGNVAVAL